MTASDILRAVADESGIGMDVMLGPDRSWRVARIRQIAMILLRERGLSLHQIKRIMKRGDHTTVVHGCRAMGERLARPALFPEYCALHDRVVARLGAREAAQ
jgi:chromosomal replication initiation ATPase DnaA